MWSREMDGSMLLHYKVLIRKKKDEDRKTNWGQVLKCSEIHSNKWAQETIKIPMNMSNAWNDMIKTSKMCSSAKAMKTMPKWLRSIFSKLWKSNKGLEKSEGHF